jgi:Skp family chaperone for outer membrane proteins
MKRTSSLLVAVLAAFALPVLAQTAPAPAKNPAATPGVDQRQANQQQRIDQGVASGQLTGKEAAKLDKGQAQVEKKEAKAKADGKVTPKEREKLKQAQNKQSKKIKQEKHDHQHDLNHDGKKDAPAAKK